MDYGYSYEVKENMAKAVSRDMSISRKHATEICSFLRRKPLERARTILEGVIEKKQAIPFKRFYHNVGFKKKIGPGRYPVKAAAEILHLLNNVTNNAQLKGLATGKLEICHICAKKGSAVMRRGRHLGREMKQTSVEVVVKEMVKKKQPETKKDKPAIKEASKDAKPVPKSDVIKNKKSESKEIKKEAKPAIKTETKEAIGKQEEAKK